METLLSLVLLMCLPLYTEQQGCPSLSNPNNGQVTGGNQKGAVATYTCSAGYLLTGSSTRTCIEPNWSGSEPSCNAKTSEAASEGLSGGAIAAIVIGSICAVAIIGVVIGVILYKFIC